VRCCKEPGDNGASLFDDPVVRDQLVRLHIDIERLRLLCTRTAWMIDQGQVPNAEASAQKVLASDLEQRLADEGMRILGPRGPCSNTVSAHVPAQGHLAQAWLLSPMLRFGGGANEIQRDIIAQRGLGLPRG
jgi:alkylation response protein AidB-like acyl-CoA dehydrogenase